MYIIAFSVVVRPQMEEEFKQESLNFLASKKLNSIRNYFVKLFKSEGFRAYIDFRVSNFTPRVAQVIP